jgi:outer membrane receptor protein involved in Fe transport
VKFDEGSVYYDRPMQGQSPYLINTGLFYKNERAKLDINLLYNRIGKRIVGVGRTIGSGETDKNVRVPDSYEMPRDAFDLTASKKFGKHFELKFAVRDILNQSVLFKQFSDVTYANGNTRKVEEITRKYKPGRNFQLSLICNL